MQWWNDAHFGMFIHYGLYSGLEGDYDGKPCYKDDPAWYQKEVELDSVTYENMAAPKFKVGLDATKVWTDLAKKAHCEYVVLTTKHHEGFGLFDSKLGRFNSKKFIGRDLVEEFVIDCHKNNLRVGFYHSLLDWNHPEYDSSSAPEMPYPIGELERTAGKKRDHTKYLEYLHSQVEELMTNYGKVDVLWFDFSHFDFEGDEAWKASELLSKVRSRQPEIVVNNRLYRRPEAGSSGDGTGDISPHLDSQFGDFITPEQCIPTTSMPVSWESCLTLNDTWSYSRFDHHFKSSRELIQTLCKVVSMGGNLLLNIGPKVDGSLSPETIDRMESIGKWMDVYDEAIKGTTQSPLDDQFEWGCVTLKNNILYLHLFDAPKDSRLSIPLDKNVKNAYFIEGGRKVEFSYSNDKQLTLAITETPNPYCSVIKLET